MKWMIASDIHGSAYYLEKLMGAWEGEKPDKLLLLGDLLYHGPRNEVPKEYDPKQVTAMLNGYKDRIYAVRGNCDAEVDQMVLEFPIMADYALLELNGVTFYATHGHVYNAQALPPIQPGDVLIHGHTHLPVAEPMNHGFLLNPGSVSLPKGGNPSSYGMLDGRHFEIREFDGGVLKEIEL